MFMRMDYLFFIGKRWTLGVLMRFRRVLGGTRSDASLHRMQSEMSADAIAFLMQRELRCANLLKTVPLTAEQFRITRDVQASYLELLERFHLAHLRKAQGAGKNPIGFRPSCLEQKSP